MAERKTRKKLYTGRLGFDPESGFHTEMILGEPYEGEVLFDKDSKSFVSEKGEPLTTPDGGETWRTADRLGERVVTDDAGQTWRYAREDDESHNARYHRQYAVVDTTANEFALLAAQHGLEEAEQLVSPHHFEAQPDDAHFDASAPGKARPTVDEDDLAARITSHTEAYAQ